MPLVLCSQHKLTGDTSLFCFVDESGTHRSPKECRCLMVRDGEGWLKSQFRVAMKKKFGKVNPDCPISDAHEPIDPRGVLLTGSLVAHDRKKAVRR